MRRTRLYQILICLLCLFPVWSQAQSLTQYEYWFDDNFSARKSAGLSGYEADIDVGIDASRLGNGLHKLCLRVQQSDGMYSPITTHYFFKAQVSNGGKLEYWFDGNRKKINTVDCHVSSDCKAYLYTKGLDLNAITPGYHTMYYRFTNDDGTTSSAVSTASVIVTSNLSNGGKLEYWFDDDRENVSTVDGKVASSGDAIIFNSDLDLKEVSQGMHRMYYRLVDAKGKPNSAVSMTPIMVKSKYNDASELKVTKYSVSVDNKEPEWYDVLKPGAFIDIPHTLDTRRLKEGEHNLTVTAWNSMNAGASLDAKFTVVPPEKPVLTLSANDWDGILTIFCNSVPNDVRYRFIEKNQDGVTNKLYETKRSHYPNTIMYADYAPEDGTYTYYAQGVYIDEEGKEHGMESNEVTITFDSTIEQEKEKLGTIMGRIDYGENADNELNSQMQIDVVFSDNQDSENLQKVRVEPNGNFRREGIPLGTQVTMTVEDDDYYTYESVSLEVTEQTQNKVQVIKATPREGVEVQVSNQSYDLIVTKLEDHAPYYFDLDITNKTDKAWSGYISLIAFKRKDAEKIENLTDEKVTFATVKPYSRVGSYYIENLDSKASTHVTINIDGFPEIKKEAYYKFYFLSQKSEQSTTKNFKKLAFNNLGVENPKDVYMPKSSSIYRSVKFSEIADPVNACIMDILDNMNELDKWWGPFGNCMGKLGELLRKYEKDKKLDDFFGNLPDLLIQYKSDLANAINDVKEITDILGYVSNFYNKINAIKDFQSSDDLTKFVTITKEIWKLSGDPFTKLYTYYLDILVESAERILKLQEKLIDAQIDDIFYNDNITFKSKVEKNGWNYPASDIDERIEDIEVHMITVAPNHPEDLTSGITAVAKYSVDHYEGDNTVVLKRGWADVPTNIGYGMARFWMKIFWKSKRVSTIPLYRDVTDWKEDGTNVKAITVTLESSTFPMDYKINLKQ